MTDQDETPDQDEIDDGFPLIRDPWDRLDATGETEKAYGAFLAYRNMAPAGRSLRRAVPLAYGPEYTEDHALFDSKWQQMQRWSTQHQWQDRCRAWDRYEADARFAAELEAIRTMRDRHAAIATHALTKAVEGLRGHTGKIAVSDIVRLIDVGVKVERLARGAPDETVVRHEGSLTVNERSNEGDDPVAIRAIVGALVEAGAMPDEAVSAVDEYLAAAGIAERDDG